MHIKKMFSSLSFKLLISALLLSLSAINIGYANQPLSDDEMRETAEKLSANNLGGLQPDQVDYLQRENEQGYVVVPKTTLPMNARQQNLINGKLTPDRIREENLADSYRNGTRDYVPFTYY